MTQEGKKAQQAREREVEKQRKAKALRDNLMRRKQAVRQRDTDTEENS